MSAKLALNNDVVDSTLTRMAVDEEFQHVVTNQ